MKKKIKQKLTIPQTLADSIPYKKVYANGIIEIADNLYSRSYKLPPLNFNTVSDDKQIIISRKWAEFIGSFGPDVTVELTGYNQTINMMDFQQQIMIPMAEDGLNEYRVEYNNMLVEKMAGAKNNLTTHKMLSISFEAVDIVEAVEKVARFDNIVTNTMVEITQGDAEVMSLQERLESLYSIYNQDETESLYREKTIEGKKQVSFSLENCISQGITTKDVIAPSHLKFTKTETEVGEGLARSYYISNYPNWLRGTMFTDFCSLPINMVISVYFNAMAPEDAVKMTKRQGVNISSALLEKQKKASHEGYDPSLISPDLQDAKIETNELMSDITKNDEKLFTANTVITVFAPDMATIKTYEGYVKNVASKHMVTVRTLTNQQEHGFNSSLPLANNYLSVQRLMTTNTVSAIIPFDVKEVNDSNGIYYGLNGVSNNLIRYDRLSQMNPNGAFFGLPGSGKSFSAKEEMLFVLLNRPQDEIYVIDPEGEYLPLVEAFGGASVKIANGSDVHINPFDINLANTDGKEDPVKIKMDFIASVCEIAIGGKYGLSPIQRSIIDRCADIMYKEHVQYLQDNNLSMDREKAPTMKDFYRILRMQNDPDAKRIYVALERFVTGSVDLFAHHTNVNVDNRFVVYDIKDIGSGLQELGLQICLDNIWNKMVSNKKASNSISVGAKHTWIYFDEFHLMLKKPTSAAYIENMWRRARKWAGVPTAITQQLEDMLKTADGRSIINNCTFIEFMSQSDGCQEQLMAMYGIAQAERKYISAQKEGMGLLKIGHDIIPKIDKFPKDTKLYKLMTTKPNEK